MRQTFTEIFAEVSAAPDRASKISILRQYDNPALRTVLRVAFDGAYQWDLPEGVPPFKTERNLPVGFAGSNLYGEARRLYIFDKAYTNVNSRKKETLFIGMLEGLHCLEADLLCEIKDNRMHEKYPGLTADVVREAYPGLLSETKRPEVSPPPPVKRGRGRPRKNPVDAAPQS
jgi:hypothetical protein